MLPPKKVTSLRKFTQFSKEEETPPKGQAILVKITIRFSISDNLAVEILSSYIQNVEFIIFCQKNFHGCVFICLFFFFFFPRSYRIEPMILEYQERAHLVGNKSF